jgi:2-polyprenyl-3-methyl-5-hydroxy-6-metoxy-1,4-benzoquinol methylase
MFDLPKPFEAEQFELFRKGISDDPTIDVYINAQSDFAFLHPTPRMNYEKYIPRVTKFGLHEYKKGLGILERRFDKIRHDLESGHRTLLEIGAGDGMFLKTVREHIPGLHLTAMDKDHNTLRSRTENSDENYDSLEELIRNKKRYDVICLFHVLEHIEAPEKFLAEIKKMMPANGRLVIEVPSLSDPLFALYDSEAFSNFYFSSQHPYIYSSSSLQRLMEYSGFQTVEVLNFQRYGLENHLNWLSRAKPGGNKQFQKIFEGLDSEYIAALEQYGKTDTVLWVGKKGDK